MILACVVVVMSGLVSSLAMWLRAKAIEANAERAHDLRRIEIQQASLSKDIESDLREKLGQVDTRVQRLESARALQR